jgi:hypothetical protein
LKAQAVAVAQEQPDAEPVQEDELGGLRLIQPEAS